MVTNVNDSKTFTDFPDIKKYIGVGTVNILSVNPNNAVLKKYGWSIPDGAKEPEYTSIDSNGKKNARVRFLVSVDELTEKPVLAVDFWVRNEYRTSDSNGELRCQVIDDYGRTAYVNKAQFSKKEIPQWSNGPAKIDKNYKMCHSGEADLVQFLRTYLNVTPFEEYNPMTKEFELTKNPGKLTFDNWDLICNGNVQEIKEMVALKPDNKMKVAFGVRTTNENKSYQAFLTSDFFPNDIYLNPSTGEYARVKNRIENFFKNRQNTNVTLDFEATPIHEWVVTATDVKDNAPSAPKEEDMPEDIAGMAAIIFG